MTIIPGFAVVRWHASLPYDDTITRLSFPRLAPTIDVIFSINGYVSEDLIAVTFHPQLDWFDFLYKYSTLRTRETLYQENG